MPSSERAESLAVLLDAMPSLVTTRTRDGRYTSVFGNRPMFDYPSQNDIIGRQTEDLLGEEAAKTVMTAVETALDTGDQQYFEFSFVFAGEQFWRGGYVAPLDRRVSGEEEAVTVTYDITVQKEREALLSDVLVEFATRTSRSALETAFCELLVERDRYAMAWLGEARSDGVVVRSSAGADAYLDALRADGDTLEATGDPGVQSLLEGGVERVVHVTDDEPWSRTAAEHSVGAVIALPLAQSGVSHGVLTVYLRDAAYLVSWRERLLRVYRDAVSQALDGAMWRWALTAETTATVMFDIPDGPRVLDLCRHPDGPDMLTVEAVIPRDGTTVYYLTANENAACDLNGVARETDSVRTLTDGTASVDAVVIDSETPEGALVEHGVRFESFALTPDRATITATVPRAPDVRSVVERVRETYPGASISVHWGEEATGVEPEIATSVAPLLTDRQYEVLETAYRYGYFEKSREHNATELAEVLDISRWTFSEHLRIAQRKLLAHLLD